MSKFNKCCCVVLYMRALPLSQTSRYVLARPTYEWVVIAFLISKARVWSGRVGVWRIGCACLWPTLPLSQVSRCL